jgi:hypothetical protein
MTQSGEFVVIPTEVHETDLVMSRQGAVMQAKVTLNSHAVERQLPASFDRAISTNSSAVAENGTRGAHVLGRFVSDERSFLAVLHLGLEGQRSARGRRKQAHVIDKRNPRPHLRKFMQLLYQLIGADSLKQAGLGGGYCDLGGKLDSQAPLPAFSACDQLADASETRVRLGEQALNGAATEQ